MPTWGPELDGQQIIGLSKDGDKLAFIYGGINILTLSTMIREKFTISDFQKMQPKSVIPIGISQVFWCPYDNNKFLLNLLTEVDTIGNGKYYLFQNLYFFYLDEMRLERITPDMVGSYGMPHKSILSIGNMLNGSVFVDNDSLQLGLNYYYELGKPRKPVSGLFIYIPQTQVLIPKKFPYIREISHNGKYIFWQDTNSFHNKLINGKLLLSGLFPLVDFASFSPNDEKLALTIQLDESDLPIQLNRFREIWILDVNKFMNENKIDYKIINLRRDFCMYSEAITNAEFLTDSSLALSMHSVDSLFQYLFEITLDGRIVRQLTFEP